jgi:hypothetical protein
MPCLVQEQAPSQDFLAFRDQLSRGIGSSEHTFLNGER